MREKVVQIIEEILSTNDLKIPDNIGPSAKLREDLGFDSLSLATLTVHIEDEFDVDIFEDGIVNTVGEIYRKIEDRS